MGKELFYEGKTHVAVSDIEGDFCITCPRNQWGSLVAWDLAHPTPEERLREAHIDREAYDGYPVEPDEEDVSPDYVGTCIVDGEPMPCDVLRVLDARRAEIESLSRKLEERNRQDAERQAQRAADLGQHMKQRRRFGW